MFSIINSLSTYILYIIYSYACIIVVCKINKLINVMFSICLQTL